MASDEASSECGFEKMCLPIERHFGCILICFGWGSKGKMFDKYQHSMRAV